MFVNWAGSFLYLWRTCCVRRESAGYMRYMTINRLLYGLSRVHYLPAIVTA